MNLLNQLNQQLFQWIGGGFAPNPGLLWMASHLAVGTSWVAAIVVAVAAWRRRADRRYILAACLMAAAAGMLTHAFAALLDQPRPFMVGLSPLWVPHGSRGSMPSTHASVMFTVALCFLYLPRLRPIGWVLAALALLTGWARVYVGIHFPLDIAGGLILGSVLAAVPVLIGKWLQHVRAARSSQPGAA